jgi:rSAM/selenodomain-associated transferase 1
LTGIFNLNLDYSTKTEPDIKQKTNRALILFSLSPETDSYRKNLNGDIRKGKKIYENILFHSLEKINMSRDDFDLIISTDKPGQKLFQKYLNNYSSHCFVFTEQKENDFENNFLSVIASAFKKGYEEVVIIGGDSPEISNLTIHKAFSELKQKNVVIGPSNDGGFYLLGLKKYNSSLFENVNWFTSKVYSQILHNLKNISFEYSILNTLDDIDTGEDLKKLLKNKNSSIKSLVRRIRSINKNFISADFISFPVLHRDLSIKHIWQKAPPLAQAAE